MRKIREKIFIIAALFVYGLLLHLLGIYCPIKFLTGISCPGCGMTRAVLSCLKLDFASAFAYHPMVFSLPVLVLYFIRDGKVFKNSFLNVAVIAVVGLGFLLNWIVVLI
jgi:hypothetical protein